MRRTESGQATLSPEDEARVRELERWGGVFDRIPGLKLVFAEALSHWVPQELMRLDEMFDMWNSKRLRERPSSSQDART